MSAFGSISLKDDEHWFRPMADCKDYAHDIQSLDDIKVGYWLDCNPYYYRVIRKTQNYVVISKKALVDKLPTTVEKRLTIQRLEGRHYVNGSQTTLINKSARIQAYGYYTEEEFREAYKPSGGWTA